MSAFGVPYDTDLWKDIVPGRQLFNIFAHSVGLDSARLKTMYIRESRVNPSPFEEIVQIFRSLRVEMLMCPSALCYRHFLSCFLAVT